MKTSWFRISGRFAVAAALIAALLPIGVAWGQVPTTCDDLCGAGSGTCVVNGLVDVEPESTIDCTGRDVHLQGNANVKVKEGTFELLGKSLRIDAGGALRAVNTTNDDLEAEDIGVFVSVTDDVFVDGGILADSNIAGGLIEVTAGGTITIVENQVNGVRAEGTSIDASGGEIVLDAGLDVIIECPLSVDGAGGESYGGSIDITAGRDIISVTDGFLRASGKHGGGGAITLTAGGDVSIQKLVEAEGRGEHGDGGTVQITAGNAVEILADVMLRGGVNAGGGTAGGGSLEIESGCGGVSIGADLYMTGGEAGAGVSNGALTIDSKGDVTLRQGVQVLAYGRENGGDGGDVSIRSGGTILVMTAVLIDGSGDTASSATGLGARVSLAGCMVQIEGTAIVDLAGYVGGSFEATAHKDPEASGFQPPVEGTLLVDSFVDVRVSGAIAERDGDASLLVVRLVPGHCTNDPTIECELNGDCTVGCETGNCLGVNPDLAGSTLGQFDITPEIRETRDVGNVCESACAGN